MAVPYLDICTQNRRTTSVHRKAAYMGACRLRDYEGEIVDFRKKSGVIYSSCRTANGEEADRQEMLTTWEAAEKRKDSVISREIKIALPCELDKDEQIALAETFRNHMVEFFNVAGSDLAVHNPPEWARNKGLGGHENPHIHLLLPDRDINGEKITKWLYKNREAIIDIRQIWEDDCNAAMEAAGLDERISMKSYDEQAAELQADIMALQAEIGALKKEIENASRTTNPEPELSTKSGAGLAPGSGRIRPDGRPAATERTKHATSAERPAPAMDGRAERREGRILPERQPDDFPGGSRPAKARVQQEDGSNRRSHTQERADDGHHLIPTDASPQRARRSEAEHSPTSDRRSAIRRGEPNQRTVARPGQTGRGTTEIAQGRCEASLENMEERLAELEREIALFIARRNELATIAALDKRDQQRLEEWEKEQERQDKEERHAQERSHPISGNRSQRNETFREEEETTTNYIPSGGPRP